VRDEGECQAEDPVGEAELVDGDWGTGVGAGEHPEAEQEGQLEVLIPAFLKGYLTSDLDISGGLKRCSRRAVWVVWDSVLNGTKTEDLHAAFEGFLKRNGLLIE
jgi:hypothetical protein